MTMTRRVLHLRDDSQRWKTKRHVSRFGGLSGALRLRGARSSPDLSSICVCMFVWFNIRLIGESRPRNVGRGFSNQPRLGARGRPYGIDPGFARLPDRGISVFHLPPSSRTRIAFEPKQTRSITIRRLAENPMITVYESDRSLLIDRERLISRLRLKLITTR